MPSAKVAITLDRELLLIVDRWVKQGKYPNRSKAIQEAVRHQAERWKRGRLAEECSKLDPAQERALSDETLGGEKWPAS